MIFKKFCTSFMEAIAPAKEDIAQRNAERDAARSVLARAAIFEDLQNHQGFKAFIEKVGVWRDGLRNQLETVKDTELKLVQARIGMLKEILEIVPQELKARDEARRLLVGVDEEAD